MHPAWKAGYAAGYRARLTGEPAVNPHTPNSYLWREWQDGAQQGYRDA